MDKYCGRFYFAWDMNGDLAVSISDIEILLKALFLLPSVFVASVLHANDQLASFFEVNCDTGRGVGGALFSLIVWGLVYLVLGTISSMAQGRRS